MRRSAPLKHYGRAARLGVALGALNQPAALTRLYGDTDKGEHGYMETYQRHLGPRRWRRQTVFEIGVGGYESRAAGGSLAIWRDYLLRSQIVGIDLHPKDITWGRRVAFAQADQNAPDQLRSVVEQHGRPDVVIDDGSHIGEHVVTSFRLLWPELTAGGLYVIEDTAASYSPAFGGDRPPPTASAVGLVRQLVSDTHALDPTFSVLPALGVTPIPDFADVAALHVYPGIVFIEKALPA